MKMGMQVSVDGACDPGSVARDEVREVGGDSAVGPCMDLSLSLQSVGEPLEELRAEE